LTCAIALPFIGRVDQRRLLPTGLVMLATGNGLSVFAGNFFLLLATRIVLGLGAACVVRAGGRAWPAEWLSGPRSAPRWPR
jgi:predicted MFS family arabinose efflux permease